MKNLTNEEIITIWKSIVDVQMHFNDIGMRIRSLFVTLLLALMAALGFLLDSGVGFKFGRYLIHFYALFPFFGTLVAYLFYFIDRYWYHRLLVGSVKHGIMIESRYSGSVPEIALSEAIGKESPYKPRGLVRCLANLLVSHDKYRESGQLHSDGKIELFYKLVIVMLVILSLCLLVGGGVTVAENGDRAAESEVVTDT